MDDTEVLFGLQCLIYACLMCIFTDSRRVNKCYMLATLSFQKLYV
jgi:hypothetical protein